jgi:hypothetical protein
MPRSWLDEMTEEMARSLPKPRFCPNLIFDFDHVRAAIALVETGIEGLRQETQRTHHKALVNAAADPRHRFVKQPVFGPMAADMWNVDMTFPLILRRSVFIAICSHLEHVLRRWGDFLHGEWKLAQDVKTYEATGKGKRTVHTLVRYLRDVAGLQIADFGNWPEWTKFDAYFVARNCLVHFGGIIEDDADRKKIGTLAYVEIDQSGLLIDASTVVHLLPGACEDAAETAKKLIERLNEACEADPRSMRT